jgi:hypothetical protein
MQGLLAGSQWGGKTIASEDAPQRNSERRSCRRIMWREPSSRSSS